MYIHSVKLINFKSIADCPEAEIILEPRVTSIIGRYLKIVGQDEIEQCTYKTEPYMIEDLVTNEELDRFCLATNTSPTIGKALKAKLLSNAVESGKYVLGDVCCTNFRCLFERLELKAQ